MELRTPAPLSDDDIYHFAETAQPAAPSAASPTYGESVGGDVSSTPTPLGMTPQTMISDPVIVTLAGPGTVASGSGALPPTEQMGAQVPTNNGESKPSTVAGDQPILPAKPTPVQGNPGASAGNGPQVKKLRTRRRKRVRVRYLMQAWGVSLVRPRGDLVGIGRGDFHVGRHHQEDHQLRLGAGLIPQRRARGAADLRRPGQHPARSSNRR